VSDEQKLLQNQGSKQNVGQNDVTVHFATVLREKNGDVHRPSVSSLGDLRSAQVGQIWEIS